MTICHSRESGNLSWIMFLWVPAFAGMTMLVSRPSFAAAAQATITSDELELQNNGELTIFTGHVILTQDPYEVHSDRMVRTKATGIVTADGHVIGTWISPKKEKVRVKGDQARYDPVAQTVEIWGKSRVHVQLDGEKGKGTFHGDRGWIFTQQPGRAKLIGQVTGHVIPAGSKP
jgi:lipopolysaccharide transport protein LptA